MVEQPHNPPPDAFVVLAPVMTVSDLPERVCKAAEAALERHGSTFNDVSFAAEVRNVDQSQTTTYPHWLVAVYGPAPMRGKIVRTGGDWAAGSYRTAWGGGTSRTVFRVGTIHRVEQIETPHT